MNPTKTIPETYDLAWDVDMKKDARLNWILQWVAIVWFVIVGWILWQIVSILRPDFVVEIPTDTLGGLFLLVMTLVIIFITIILHELVHGFFFWFFTQEKPLFGFKLNYAYAAAPDWYFPKDKYLVIALSPLVVLTVFGLLAIALIPPAWIGILFLSIVFNAGGAVGDLYIGMRIGVEAQNVWVKDKGDAFEVYRPRR